MKRSLIAVAAAAALLVGCSGTLDTDGAVKWIQDRAVQICSYRPAVISVTQVVLATNATVEATFENIAQAICTAVANWQQQTKQSSINAMVMPCPTVNGICIEGEFVNKPEGGQ